LTIQQLPSPAGLESRQSPRAGWSLVLLAATLWGTTGLIFKALDTGNQTNALSISFLRLALSVPFILVGARLLLGRWLVRLTVKGAFTLAGVGASMALYQLTYVLAIERVGVAIAVLISICGAPVVIALISVLFFGERFHPRIVLALIASVVGAVLLVGFPDTGMPASERFWSGVAIAVACAVFQAFFVLAARAAGAVAHPLHSAGIGFAFGAAMLLPFAVYHGLALRYTAEGWLLLLYVGAVPTAIAQTFFLMGLKTTGAIGGAVASLLEPLVTTVLAVLILGEQIGLIGYVGAVVLLSGIALAQWERPATAEPVLDPGGSSPDPAERPRATVEAVRADWKDRLPGSMQRFLTWLMGYPYAGQKPLFQNKP
ncbi:MAG: DMT family transporter, partial [Nevskiales bacterium]